MGDCCCKDIHRDTCFAIRYPEIKYDPCDAHPETCECPCHDQYDNDECDCYDCHYDTNDDDIIDADDIMREEISQEEFLSDLDRENREDWIKQEDGDWDD
jgi:hypothetical protein